MHIIFYTKCFPYLSVPGTEASGMTVDRTTVCVDVLFMNYHCNLWRKKSVHCHCVGHISIFFLWWYNKTMWTVYMLFKIYLIYLKAGKSFIYNFQRVNTKCEYYCLFKWLNWILLLFCVIMTCTYWFCQGAGEVGVSNRTCWCHQTPPVLSCDSVGL